MFEDIRNIRKLYHKGNDQGKRCRARMNSWSFAETKRQIVYKAKWNGLPIIQLTKQDTRGTVHSAQNAESDSKTNGGRDLWCELCQRWMVRDVIAVMNQSLRGLLRFSSSQGVVCETMKRNLECNPVILRVDATKLSPIDEK